MPAPPVPRMVSGLLPRRVDRTVHGPLVAAKGGITSRLQKKVKRRSDAAKIEVRPELMCPVLQPLPLEKDEYAIAFVGDVLELLHDGLGAIALDLGARTAQPLAAPGPDTWVSHDRRKLLAHAFMGAWSWAELSRR